MTTRADIRNRVRNELNDTATGNYLYADALLNGYIEQAIHNWSDHNPGLTRATIVPVVGQRAYNLPNNVISVVSLEQPEGTEIAAGQIENQRESYRAISVIRIFNQVWSYDLVDRALWLRYPSEAGEANLVYTATIAYLNPNDDITTLELLPVDEQALVWFACDHALQWLETQRQKRGDQTRLPQPNVYAKRYRQAVVKASRRKGIISNQLQPQV